LKEVEGTTPALNVAHSSDVIGAGGLTVFLVNTVRFRPLGSFGWPPVLNMPPVGTATAGKFTPTVDEELPRAATSPRAS
jgi:hypothetical protein